MKKLFILLLAAFTYAGAQAQTAEDARRIILGEPKRNITTQQDPRDILGTREERRVYDENRYPSKNKSYKSKNNGKRLGWEKGVGNPHRTGAVQSKKHKHAGKGKGKKG